MSDDTKVTNLYGVHADFRGWWPDRPMVVAGENLAAKLIFADRIVRVDWEGVVTTEWLDEINDEAT